MGRLRAIHRYFSLALATLWLVQVLTGAVLVFRWELDDWSVRGPAAPLDVAALGARLEALQARFPSGPVQLYASGGEAGRFDVLVQRTPGRLDDVRVDGRGDVLRWRPWNYDYGEVGLLTFAAWLHDTLFVGAAGPWLLALSGALLASNIVLGLKLAWPRAGAWRKALTPKAAAGGGRRLFAWHRAVGLWTGLAALVVVATGVVTALDEPIRRLIGAQHPSPAPASSMVSGAPISAAKALHLGMTQHPRAQLYSLVLPSAAQPWFRIGLRQPGEPERFAGQTAVYVARNGRLLLDDDALRTSARVRMLDAMYALHTGEILGLAGRALALITALALTALTGLGTGLWLVRRRLRTGS